MILKINRFFRKIIASHYTFYQVGCRTKWSYFSDKSTPFCTHGQQYRWNDYLSRITAAHCFRMMGDFYASFGYFQYEDIRKITGCTKPCKYLKYSVTFSQYSTVSIDSPHFTFSVLVSSCLTSNNIISLV